MSAPVDPATPADEIAAHAPAQRGARPATAAASGPPPEDARAAERGAPSAPPTAPPAPRPPGQIPPAADLQSQTITIVIQLQPADGDPAGRPVLVSVRAGQCAPLFAAPLRYSALGVLPGPITALLQQLQLRSLEQRRKTPVPPSRPATASAAPAPPPASAAATGAPAPPSTSPPLAPPAPTAPTAVPPPNPASTQLTMF